MGLLDFAGNIISTNMTNKANKKMAEYSYSKDLEMWNRSNEYNNPANQMLRLKSAGLNPNLVYGSGSVVGNTSGQMPKYNSPTMNYDFRMGNPMSELSTFQDLKIKQLQTDNLREQIKGVAIDNVIKSVEAEWKPYNAEIDWQKNVRENDRLRYENRRTSQTLEGQIQRDNALVAPTITKSQADAKSAQIEQKIKEIDLKYRKWGTPAVQNLLNLLRIFKP